MTLREKYANMEIFVVLIFPHLDWMRENTDQKKLRIWILFTQCEIKFVVKEGSETGRDRVREKKNTYFNFAWIR